MDVILITYFDTWISSRISCEKYKKRKELGRSEIYEVKIDEGDLSHFCNEFAF